MYKELSAISFMARVYLCYLTIDAVPIFENEATTWLIGQIISIYTLLWLASYTIVGKLGYEKGDSPVLGVVLYAVVYIALAIVAWIILLGLNHINILPI